MMSKFAKRAISVTGLLTIFLILGVIVNGSLIPPLLGLYVLVLVHTYFSVKIFSRLISPYTWRQHSVDFVLVLAYLGLALSLKQVQGFFIFWVALFLLASLKYSLEINHFIYPKLLKRKIIADLSGVGLGMVSLVMTPWWSEAAWFAFVLMLLASVYTLILKPLYTTD
jgi:hypothetical protein